MILLGIALTLCGALVLAALPRPRNRSLSEVLKKGWRVSFDKLEKDTYVVLWSIDGRYILLSASAAALTGIALVGFSVARFIARN